MKPLCLSVSIGYRVKKRWFGFWQKYKLRTHLKIASKLFVIFLVVWLIASILTVLSQWKFSDKGEGTPFQGHYIKYFWAVIIELISGFDIQEPDFKLHPVSQILTVIVLITGVVILAIFTGQIVSMFIHALQRINYLPEKPEDFAFRRPIVIYGVNQKLYKIIEELRRSCLTKGREIVIVDNEADQLRIKDKEVYKDIWYVKGNRADRAILKRTLGQEETAAIILAAQSGCQTDGRYADSRAIETALAIEGLKEKSHTVLELMDERNIPHLTHTRINEWISIFEYGIKLTSQAALQHGMGSVYLYLLGGGPEIRETNQIHFTQVDLPEKFNNRTYEEIREKIRSQPDADVTLIGFARYIAAEVIDKYNLNLEHLPYIQQLNPVSRVCRICSDSIQHTDELGRIQNKCPRCFAKERSRNRDAVNRWFYPKDTSLKCKDRLIYLADKPFDFNKIFMGNK